VVHDEVHELVDGNGDSRLAETDVLVRAVVWLSISKHAERAHQLLQCVGLRPPCRVDLLAPKGAAAYFVIHLEEDVTGDAEPTVEHLLPVQRRAPPSPKVVLHDAFDAGIEITLDVGDATGNGASVALGATVGERALHGCPQLSLAAERKRGAHRQERYQVQIVIGQSSRVHDGVPLQGGRKDAGMVGEIVTARVGYVVQECSWCSVNAAARRWRRWWRW